MIADASDSVIADDGQQALISSDYVSIDGVAVAMLPNYPAGGGVASVGCPNSARHVLPSGPSTLPSGGSLPRDGMMLSISPE